MITERLEWEFESAPVREQLRLRARKPLPFEQEILDRCPDYDEVVADVLRALNDLDTCRPVGLAIGPIPITAVWQYLDRQGYDRGASAILSRAILDADRVSLALRAKKKASAA